MPSAGTQLLGALQGNHRTTRTLSATLLNSLLHALRLGDIEVDTGVVYSGPCWEQDVVECAAGDVIIVEVENVVFEFASHTLLAERLA